MTNVTVRKATADDASALAHLRMLTVTDGAGYSGPDREEFLEWFSHWVRGHLSTHLPFIAELDGDVVGIAWLMIAERVPGSTGQSRLCGDVQSVYVAPEVRERGIGTAMMKAVLDEAGELNLEHVTVHANDRAMALYKRSGFQHDRCWLRWQRE